MKTSVPQYSLSGDPAIRRILVIKWSAMGDVVIASAMFEDLHRAFPQAEIDLNTLPPWDRLFFAEDDRFTKLLTIDLRGREGGLRGLVKWLRAVNARRYDLLVDLQGNDRSRLLVTLLHLIGRNIPYRIGTHRRYPYNVYPVLAEGETVSAFECNQRALQAAGIATLTERPQLRIPLRHQEQGRALLAACGAQEGRFAVFLPGCHAASRAKRWGSNRYAELAKRLFAAGLPQVLLVGGKDEVEDCRQIEELVASDRLVNLCGKTAILDLVEIFRQSSFIVGNDTGTAHLASCTERTILILCGPTDPKRVKPIGENVVALQADLECVNCYKKDCDHLSCMAQLTPELVFTKIEALMGPGKLSRATDV